ncbi:IS3 family transposase [Bacillus wiedmannii]|uniref:IS3 family transposase n=1 Tax=Bacillus wiedmannii TaxID=1890302 RepID=UPI003857B9C4
MPKIVLEYIHYYNCVRIQEKLNHLSLKNLGNKWFRCFDSCPVFGVHFTHSVGVFIYILNKFF